MNTVEVKNLYVKYNYGALALQNINFSVSKGEVLTVLGGVEAGKTTLIKGIAGLYTPTRGMVVNDYEDILKLDIKDRNVSVLYADNNFFEKKTVRYNLSYPLFIRKIEKSIIDKKVGECLSIMAIQELADKRMCDLSEYEKLKAAISRLFIRQPRLFLIDNPFKGFNSEDRWKIFQKLYTYIDDLKFIAPVIFTTDNVGEASVFGEKVILLNYGVQIGEGSISDLKANPESVIAYQLFYPQAVVCIKMVEIQNGDVFIVINDERIYLKRQYFINECYIGGEVTACFINNGEVIEKASLRLYDTKSERLIYNKNLLA